MSATILNRLIFWELVKVFLLSLGTLTGLLVTAGLIQQALQMGLSLTQVLGAVHLFVPNTLPYTIPATTLFASCVVYGRLSHDNEVVAIKAAGVHLFTILKPALLLGVITTTTTAALYHTVIPRSQQLLYKQLLDNPEELIYNMLRRDRSVRHPKSEYVLFVRDVQGKTLIDVVVKKRAKIRDLKGGPDTFHGYEFEVRAPKARLRVDQAEGKLYVDADRWTIYNPKTSGATRGTGPFPMDLPDGLNGKDGKVRVSTIVWGDLPAKAAELHEEMAEIERKRQKNRENAEALPNPDQRTLALDQDRHFKFQADNVRRTLRNVEAESFLRPALACGCLLFALVGCPVGIWANRADYLSTFVICFLPAVFVYYPLLLAGGGLGRDGKLPLALGCWLANIVLASIAVLLNARLLRR
jgi:lipopolysaccharide export system permease protein